jgi:hypothetical protein
VHGGGRRKKKANVGGFGEFGNWNSGVRV